MNDRTISEAAKNCPMCKRPMNMGNSPNELECTETDDDEGLCAAYAKIRQLQDKLDAAAIEIETALGDSTPKVDKLNIPIPLARRVYNLAAARVEPTKKDSGNETQTLQGQKSEETGVVPMLTKAAVKKFVPGEDCPWMTFAPRAGTFEYATQCYRWFETEFGNGQFCICDDDGWWYVEERKNNEM